ncbi:MAG TPA: hypothetical protein VJA18_04235 [Candidatus Nanoarchaeia archaeon]|nr:hypothetical protein [Candidatus Nanoarchaeia archaeon]
MTYELYAYATRADDGTLRILHTNDVYKSESVSLTSRGRYRIPVCGDKETIERYGNFFPRENTDHELVDVRPLLESNVLSKDSLLDISLGTEKLEDKLRKN